MGYQVLARKWRPQDFSGVIGQEPVVTALQNAVSGERIAHAYLFSGIRGVGKTSVARILAKGLNCEKGPAAEPCNQCGTCREITTGGDFDVIEVDAATYSKAWAGIRTCFARTEAARLRGYTAATFSFNVADNPAELVSMLVV